MTVVEAHAEAVGSAFGKHEVLVMVETEDGSVDVESETVVDTESVVMVFVTVAVGEVKQVVIVPGDQEKGKKMRKKQKGSNKLKVEEQAATVCSRPALHKEVIFVPSTAPHSPARRPSNSFSKKYMKLGFQGNCVQ